MPVHFRNANQSQEITMSTPPAKRVSRRCAVVPLMPLDQPGRLRVAHLQALYGISHTTVYKRIKEGLIPPPDGWDMPNRPIGKQGRPYWNTATLRPFFSEKSA